jgi:hypothetical protein
MKKMMLMLVLFVCFAHVARAAEMSEEGLELLQGKNWHDSKLVFALSKSAENFKCPDLTVSSRYPSFDVKLWAEDFFTKKGEMQPKKFSDIKRRVENLSNEKVTLRLVGKIKKDAYAPLLVVYEDGDQRAVEVYASGKIVCSELLSELKRRESTINMHIGQQYRQ